MYDFYIESESEYHKYHRQARNTLANFGHDTGHGGVVEFFLSVVHRFVETASHHLPVKKILLLTWKSVAVLYGKTERERQREREKERDLDRGEREREREKKRKR